MARPWAATRAPTIWKRKPGASAFAASALTGGGYDPGGTYWGRNAPLFYACDGDGNSRFFRAADRASAKAQILADYPDARFYR